MDYQPSSARLHRLDGAAVPTPPRVVPIRITSQEASITAHCDAGNGAIPIEERRGGISRARSAARPHHAGARTTGNGSELLGVDLATLVRALAAVI
jgi:hypothetical protein